jgi:saccharopine dehydrogenase-like NADP-dependent oxidoreductase
MSKVLIIGAGGVGGVVAHKAAMERGVFSDVMLASRRIESCNKLAAEIEQMHGRKIRTAQVDADNVAETTKLLQEYQPKLCINVALPYQDLSIMDACLAAGVDYLDTANYEPPDVAKFEYKWQWAYQERFAKAGRMALLGSGFDPGVTNVYCAYIQKHLLDEVHYVDIVDCNAGSHGKAFANFNPGSTSARSRRAAGSGRRRVEGDRAAQRVEGVRLPGCRRAQQLPAVSRGARVARQAPEGPAPHPVLMTFGELPETSVLATST